MMRMYDETIQHSTFNIHHCGLPQPFNIQHSTFTILLLRSMHFMELVDVSAFHFKLILS